MSEDSNKESEEEQRDRIEREGYLFFQRCGEPEWEDINSFYAYTSHESAYLAEEDLSNLTIVDGVGEEDADD